jgi:hypothetical protein
LNGPITIIDKSLLQALSPDEVDELCLHFSLVETPVLIQEIVADLRTQRKGRVPLDVVKALARKMSRAHASRPVNFRKAAIADLHLYYVPMIGQIPLDTSQSNVHVSKDGKGLLYDKAPEQEMWARWEDGDFSGAEQSDADDWRRQIAEVDLEHARSEWKQHFGKRFDDARDLQQVIQKVDELLASFSAEVQRELVHSILDFLEAPRKTLWFVSMLGAAGLIPRLKDLAPYAASLARLRLTFLAGLSRGFIGPRPEHLADMQYLFYAPFCMVFISSDSFHRDMWAATSGRNTFLWGPQVKADLARRRAEREKLQPPSTTEFNDSIDFVWRKYFRRMRNEPVKPRPRNPKEDAAIIAEINARMKEFETYQERPPRARRPRERNPS